ncbi:MAG: bifunctional riboflavin kinase/FAD synthetase [Ruminococcus sp.]|nr:bifunctional riboflavin kinase/FAD synthetase [Ruminococcus sp.]
MQIFDSIRKTEYNTSVALGFFDGVHKGHAKVINQCVNNASDNCKSVVLTFKNSPSATLGLSQKPLLTTNEHKFELFEKLNIDIVFCIDFDDIKNMSAEEFVKEVLFEKLNAKFVCTGFNYHFGKGGNATADDMLRLCKECAITAQKCEPVMFLNEAISSTRIRDCIINGEIENANAMLSYDFTLSGEIISGNHIGTTLNTPTINLSLNSDIVTPHFGVYATKVVLNNKTYIGATNIGVHPTVGGDTPVCETHLLDFSGGDLYHKHADIKLLKFIRSEHKFDSTDELMLQINKDKATILEYFGE